ncbi:helix-turn-helix domain-containing protein [Nocardiopsis synnemataformans]|uniref:helix-turn-helix domain-containing protein n=1 Tax=Nocardiopsis synnemataformans TaxID=61305 RepID=UPI003EC05E68
MQAKTSPAQWHPKRFRDALKQLREHLKVKQVTFARWADVGEPQVSRWSAGKSRPGYDSLRRMLMEAIAQRPDDEVVHRLAAAVSDAAGYPQMPLAPEYETEESASPYSDQAWKIVTSLEAKAKKAGLPPELERALIEQAMENAERQAEMMFDAGLRRYEQGEAGE